MVRTQDWGPRGPGSNPAGAISLRNFGNSIYPTLPVSFGGASMPGGSEKSQERGKLTPPLLEKDNSKIKPECSQYRKKKRDTRRYSNR